VIPTREDSIDYRLQSRQPFARTRGAEGKDVPGGKCDGDVRSRLTGRNPVPEVVNNQKAGFKVAVENHSVSSAIVNQLQILSREGAEVLDRMDMELIRRPACLAEMPRLDVSELPSHIDQVGDEEPIPKIPEDRLFVLRKRQRILGFRFGQRGFDVGTCTFAPRPWTLVAYGHRDSPDPNSLSVLKPSQRNGLRIALD